MLTIKLSHDLYLFCFFAEFALSQGNGGIVVADSTRVFCLFLNEIFLFWTNY